MDDLSLIYSIDSAAEVSETFDEFVIGDDIKSDVIPECIHIWRTDYVKNNEVCIKCGVTKELETFEDNRNEINESISIEPNLINVKGINLKMKRFYLWHEGQNYIAKSFNEDLRTYIQKYNTTPHSSLEDNMSPNDRFYKESNTIIEMSQEKIEKSFLLELERTVSPDSVIKIDNIEYEVDYHYQSQKVLLRYSPDLSKVYVVDKSDDSLKEIKLLDKKSNSGVKREKISLSEIGE